MKLLACIALVLGLASEAAAQGPPWARGGRTGGPPSFKMLLERFDADEDGAISEDEVPPGLWRRLREADADGDGKVTAEEFAAALKMRGAR